MILIFITFFSKVLNENSINLNISSPRSPKDSCIFFNLLRVFRIIKYFLRIFIYKIKSTKFSVIRTCCFQANAIEFSGFGKTSVKLNHFVAQ